MSKKVALVGLVGINLLLLAGLILSSYSLPAAMAQRGRGRPGDFVMATVQIHNDYDALAIVNIPEAALHVFVPTEVPGGAKLTFTDSRDLNRDFVRH